MANHTGQDTETIAKDADRDYWLSAEEAKDYGLIDSNICDGIAAGVFPAYPRPRGHPSHCDYCDADRSRAGELRAQILRKADSPELAGWIRVGARELLAIEEHLRLAEGPPAGTEDGPEERR